MKKIKINMYKILYTLYNGFVMQTLTQTEEFKMSTFHAKLLARQGYTPSNWYVAHEDIFTVTFHHIQMGKSMEVVIEKTA